MAFHVDPSEEQIIGTLKEHEAGVSVADLCRKHGVSDASFEATVLPVTPYGHARRSRRPQWSLR
jgi:putative transposase